MLTPQEITTKYIDPWLNRIAISPAWVLPVVSLAIGYRVDYQNGKPAGWGARISFGRSETDALFYNGVLFIRVMLPLFFGIHIRWSGKDRTAREFLQAYFGWKLNGVFSVVFRIQSDASAAAGFTSPNFNQASGWSDGRK